MGGRKRQTFRHGDRLPVGYGECAVRAEREYGSLRFSRKGLQAKPEDGGSKCNDSFHV